MRLMICAALAAIGMAGPAQAQSDLEAGFAGALRGCEEWVLNPASWAGGVAPFLSAVGLGNRMAPVDRVEEVSLPPPPLRVANHYWRINSTAGAGYILVVSDQLPMCHITGGGDVDLQPVVSSIIASDAFRSRWKLLTTTTRADMESSEFKSIEDPDFSIVISRASKPGGRLDRVQVLATATFKIEK